MRQRRFFPLGAWPRQVLCVFFAIGLYAADHSGTVRFGGLPLPGAEVTLTQGGEARGAVTDPEGRYSFEGLADTPFAVEVKMQLFAPQQRELPARTAAAEWDLELLPRDQIAGKAVRAEEMAFATASVNATAQSGAGAPEPAAQQSAVQTELAQQAADGFLISGSVHNAAASPFSQMPAIGNHRRAQRSLYNGNLGVILNNAIFDARAYSLTGQNTLKPAYSRVQGVFSFGGPLRIPRLLERNGPQFSINYQWTRNRNAMTQTGLMPTEAERAGVFAAPILDPSNGLPFPENRIPSGRFSPQALALLRLYPLPNFPGSTRYNYQLPIVDGLHQDDLQSRVNKQFRRHTLSGQFGWQSIRTDRPDLFGFLDTGRVRGWDTTAAYRRSLNARTFFNFSVNFNRLTTRTVPYFSNRENVSGLAGIEGNNQEAVNWGPPNLSFQGGISPIAMDQASLVRNQTVSTSADFFTNRNRHNLTGGFTHRRQQFNLLTQQDARGSFGFTGAAAGSDFAGFLLGVPDTSSIAFGNADKYLRGRVNEAFLNDDWRVNPNLTINVGLRWEYWTPVSEKYGRLVNLAIGPDFQSIVPDATLPRPDRNNIAPRLAVSWRPLPASSIVVRGGYGVYFDTSIYQPIATEMSQQAPLSKNLRVSNSPATPLTLAYGFPTEGLSSPTTFGVDPDFRVGRVEIWRLAVQSDLPGALQMTVSYTGNRGAHGQQRVLPNTFPGGALDPSGFLYLVTDGSSSRHAGEFQLRRRMRSGLTAQLQYTWSKSLDNALLGGRGMPLIAQNWRDLHAERGRSSFDQRHLVNASVQYTTGMGLRGGALLSGRVASLLKDWTLGSQLTWGTGLPLTPLLPLAVPGTGFMGVLRPDATGASPYDTPSGLNLNPAAFAAPLEGAWGNAGRNSVTGPRQFVLNASLGRTLRTWDRVSLDMRIDASNITNTPTFPSWNAVLGNAQFGLPNVANPMRMAQITMRLGF